MRSPLAALAAGLCLTACIADPYANRDDAEPPTGEGCGFFGACVDGGVAPPIEPEPPVEPEPPIGPGEPEPIGPPPLDNGFFNWLLIFDDGAFEPEDGTPGADICGVETACGTPTSAVLTPGSGMLCVSDGPGCPANRTDPIAALDDGARCDWESAPSDFVSLGEFGSLFIEFDADLRGCTLMIVELAGRIPEPYSVFVCDSIDLEEAFCLNNDAPVVEAFDGGSVTVDVPAE